MVQWFEAKKRAAEEQTEQDETELKLLTPKKILPKIANSICTSKSR